MRTRFGGARPNGMSWPSSGRRERSRVARWLAEASPGPGPLRRAARSNLVTKLMVVMMVLMALLVVDVLLTSGISAL